MSKTFSFLPLEIRLQIWAFCVPSPRILTFKLDYSRMPDLYSQNPQPVLLSINHESREFLLTPTGGGYVLIRIIDTQVAFHPSKDSICFFDGTSSRCKILDLSTQDGETMRIRKLVVKEEMLTYWLEESEHGNRLRDWLVDHIDVFGMVPMLQEETSNETSCSSAMSEIRKLKERLDDREGVPWTMLDLKAWDTDVFCRELVKMS